MITQAKSQDTAEVAQLALQLWPGNSLEDFIHEISDLIKQPDAAVFLAFHGSESIGFAQCQLRYDYVEGTGSSPVGYLEGLYVKNDFRNQGVAEDLVNACENWAKRKGCREFASDCELDNEVSIAVHHKLGFKEVNRVVCFKKDL
ncbi:GNAT family N-acetyltransferase [Halobacillus yeomjeoni]|uniref:aminoglycoside 6'-N-acetyltransferase n=1 Tax=Halobacillus yeomjeoni TaxID=311194 RepID=UPI001CD64FE1|nr:aminoglycoside 6'-N-acetyltransferase [Halobacillus yeomjeoni]MCA0983458.1 GNAT family N-acetyltransferase [Halobacillus yeomjeoni]